MTNLSFQYFFPVCINSPIPIRSFPNPMAAHSADPIWTSGPAGHSMAPEVTSLIRDRTSAVSSPQKLSLSALHHQQHLHQQQQQQQQQQSELDLSSPPKPAPPSLNFAPQTPTGSPGPRSSFVVVYGLCRDKSVCSYEVFFISDISCVSYNI